MKRRQPQRLWADARAKVDSEATCRFWRLGNCSGKLEAAHVLSRSHDEPRGSKLYVHPDRIFPCCSHHHRQFDAHKIDAESVLTTTEQAQAVLDAGSMALVQRRVSVVHDG